jgi:prepilin-type N-terminal cleavage/methylation domain-containing protein
MDPTHPSSSQSGDTLIEVLVTAVIVALIAAATATALISGAHASGDQRLRATADALAAQDQQRMRGLSEEQLAGLGGSGQSYLATADGVRFTVTSTTAAATSTGTYSCAGPGASDFQSTSTVSWTEGFNTASNSVSADSLIARPMTGDLVAQVNDQADQPVPGVGVSTQSGPSDQSGVTDDNGCLLFAGLTPGAYAIAFSKAGYVDPQGNSSPTLAVPVTATATPTRNLVSLAPAGAITAALTAAGTSGAPTTNGDADALSWSSVAEPTPSASPSTATATSLTTPGLYPFDTAASGATPSYTDNYTLWAGGCAAQAPPSPVIATVAPGIRTNVTIAEPELVITKISTPAGVAVTPKSLTLSFSSLTGTSCTDTWTPPVAKAVSSGVPPATGWLQDPGQPYADGTTGSLTVCASYVKASVVSYGTARVTNANLVTPTPASITLTPATRC